MRADITRNEINQMEKASKYTTAAETTDKIIEIDKSKASHTFDEAAELTGNGPYHYLLLLVVGLSLSVVVAEGLSMSVVLPSVRCEFQLSNVQQGTINAAGFAGIVFTSHFWGFLTDTWGRQKVLTLALLTSFVSSILSSFSICYEMLLVFRLCVGLCIAGVQAAAISYLGEFHCHKNRTKWVTYAAMFMPLALIYVPSLAWAIVPLDFKLDIFGFIYTPWRLHIMCLSLLSAVTFSILAMLPESPEFLLAMGKKSEALAVLRRIYEVNTGNKKDTYPVKDILLNVVGMDLLKVDGIKRKLAFVWNQTVPIFKRPSLWNVITMCVLAISLFAIAHGTYMWLPMMLSLYYDDTKTSKTLCQSVTDGLERIEQNQTSSIGGEDSQNCVHTDPWAYELTVFIGMAIVGTYIIVAVLLSYIPRKYLLTSLLLIASIGSFGVVFGNNFYLNIILVVVLMNSGNCVSILVAVSADLFPTHYKAMALCFIMMAGRIGAAVGSSIVGVLLDYSCNMIFISEGALMIFCCFLCYYILTNCDKMIQSK